jgi:hypothetical protein
MYPMGIVPRKGTLDGRVRLRRRRLARRAAILAILGIGATLLLVSCGGRVHRSSFPSVNASARGDKSQRSSVTPPSAILPSTTAPPSTTTTGPGTLPQTDTLPSAQSAQFQSQMAALWTGIIHNSPGDAMPAFFPETAYLQLKTISDASGDFENRLMHDYALDIAAANSLLGPGATTATLVSVNVPAENAHWITVGICDNDVGYFEVANSRIVYQEGGQTRSIGIASLISWRGVWYVVHLGAILRSTDSGVVLDPQTGPGSSPPSSTC